MGTTWLDGQGSVWSIQFRSSRGGMRAAEQDRMGDDVLFDEVVEVIALGEGHPGSHQTLIGVMHILARVRLETRLEQIGVLLKKFQEPQGRLLRRRAIYATDLTIIQIDLKRQVAALEVKRES